MSHKTPLALLIVLTLLIGTDYLSAWTAPLSVTPPASNVAAPLNTGAAHQIKPGGLEMGSLVVNGGSIFRGSLAVQNAAPTIQFTDTDNRDFWTHINDSYYYLLGDRNNDGAWNDTWPVPVQMYQGATPGEDWVRFANQVRANEYCDTNGGNCIVPGTTGQPAGTVNWGGFYVLRGSCGCGMSFCSSSATYSCSMASPSCLVANPATGGCGCPSGFAARSEGSRSNVSCSKSGSSDTVCNYTAPSETIQCYRL